MTETPKALTESEVLDQPVVDAGVTPESVFISAGVEPRRDESSDRRERIEAGVEEIGRRFASIDVFLLPGLEDRIRRRLGLAPQSAGGAALSGLVGVGIRLGLVLLVTAVAGQSTAVAWGQWVAIIVWYGVWDATQPWRTPPVDASIRPSMRRYLDNWFALPTTIVRESDVRDLADFTGRWVRLRVSAPVGVGVAALMLGTCRLLTPTALSELPVGSVVLLAFLLYDFGALMVFGDFFWWGFTARQARYDHHLFWPSPGDSPEVGQAMRMQPLLANAWWITVYLALTLVLLSWDSLLVVPLALGFIVIGYLVTIAAAIGSRAGVRKIIDGSRRQRLARLRHRIDAFESRFEDLSRRESAQLRDLLFLHNAIRDAPTSSPHGSTLARAAAALILPTIMFVVTVFGEVSAERFLDAILP